MDDRATISLEETYFRALAHRLPGQVLYNGDGGAATAYLSDLGLRLPDRHWDLGLGEDPVGATLGLLMQEFGGARARWPADRDLLAGIDGVIADPPFGPCLVEVDTPEHFSPYRLRSLDRLAGVIEHGYDVDRLRSYCREPKFFAQFWEAAGLPPRLLPRGGVVTHPGQFAAILARAGRSIGQAAQVRPVGGFRFVGGRAAQRAYDDSLVDCAHLAVGWRERGFRPVLRVASWDLADETRRLLEKVES